MAQCQPSNAFGYITKSPSYSPFISNCLENKLINTSMIFPEKSEKSRETSPTSPMKFPRFGTPLPWKNHPMIPMMKNDMSRSRPPDWMWTWKLDFSYPQKKLFWKVKWYNPVNLWLHEISDNKKKMEDISPYLSSVNHGEIEDLTAADRGWTEAGHEELCDLVFGEAVGLQAQPLHRWSLPINHFITMMSHTLSHQVANSRKILKGRIPLK